MKTISDLPSGEMSTIRFLLRTQGKVSAIKYLWKNLNFHLIDAAKVVDEIPHICVKSTKQENCLTH